MDGSVAGWPTGRRRMGAGSRVTLARSRAQYTIAQVVQRSPGPSNQRRANAAWNSCTRPCVIVASTSSSCNVAVIWSVIRSSAVR